MAGRLHGCAEYETDECVMSRPVLRTALSIVALVFLAVLFLTVNVLANATLRGVRLDLTESRLFTLSEGTIEILTHLDEPVSLTLYFSEKQATGYPSLHAWGLQVRDMLEEMALVSNGKLQLEIVDPDPFGPREDEAISYGLRGTPTIENNVIWLGLTGTNLLDNVEIIPFFSEERARWLEYDLTRLLVNLTRPEKPVLGIVTNLPLDTGAGGLPAALRGNAQPFLIYEELIDRFQIEFLEQDFSTVPPSIDVLMLAHPKPLSDKTLYAIDQFALGGGRIAVFVDPHSEVSLTAGPDGKPIQGYTESSDLPKLLYHWGVIFEGSEVATDRQRAMEVATGSSARQHISDYILWLSLTDGNMAQNDPVTADINRLNLGIAGHLRPRPESSTRYSPLVFTTKDSMVMDVNTVKQGLRPESLLSRFTPSGEALVLAARLEGALTSAFPEGLPESDMSAHREYTLSDANIIIVADSDLFDDRFWAESPRFPGDRLVVPFADNARFVLGVLENLAGAQELLSLRGRNDAARPFVLFDQLRRQAGQRLIEQEQTLQERVDQLSQQLAQLERQIAQGSTTNNDEWTSIDHLQEELASSRRALRMTRHSLNLNIERWSNMLRFANIVLIPLGLLLITLLGTLVGRMRQSP
ncbi:MAG: Gldg family protein [Parvularculales bacterium]